MPPCDHSESGNEADVCCSQMQAAGLKKESGRSGDTVPSKSGVSDAELHGLTVPAAMRTWIGFGPAA